MTVEEIMEILHQREALARNLGASISVHQQALPIMASLLKEESLPLTLRMQVVGLVGNMMAVMNGVKNDFNIKDGNENGNSDEQKKGEDPFASLTEDDPLN